MLNLIPKPLRAAEKGGSVPFSRKTALEGDFSHLFGALQPMMPDAGNAAENRLAFRADSALPPEAYRIACAGDKNISVFASGDSGAFYAAMTLLQLADGGGSIPAVEIEDAPRFRHRGFMLDCARHFWPVDKIKQILDAMARIKMNVFHWHLTDDQGWRIEIKKYPLLAEKGSIRKSTPLSLPGHEGQKEPRDCAEYGRGLYYTQEDAREVVAHAARRNISIVPEIEMPGHFVAAIACYPELSCTEEKVDVSDSWGVLENIACCGKESVYRFAKDIIDELCALFPYPYFHIGGDEAPKGHWKACPNCQRKIRELGLKDENALQAYFNNEISAYLKAKGKRTVGWNEILEGENLDSAIIPQWWTLLGDSAREKKWIEDGNQIILSLADYVYMDHAFAVRPLEKTYGFGPEVFGIGDESNILGVEAPQWTEYIRDEQKLDMNTFARLAAMAEVGWTAAENKDYGDFEARLENLRGYFSSIRAPIAPQFIYRGDTVGEKQEERRVKKGWEMWSADPCFELKLMKEKEEA